MAAATGVTGKPEETRVVLYREHSAPSQVHERAPADEVATVDLTFQLMRSQLSPMTLAQFDTVITGKRAAAVTRNEESQETRLVLYREPVAPMPVRERIFAEMTRDEGVDVQVVRSKLAPLSSLFNTMKEGAEKIGARGRLLDFFVRERKKQQLVVSRCPSVEAYNIKAKKVDALRKGAEDIFYRRNVDTLCQLNETMVIGKKGAISPAEKDIIVKYWQGVCANGARIHDKTQEQFLKFVMDLAKAAAMIKQQVIQFRTLPPEEREIEAEIQMFQMKVGELYDAEVQKIECSYLKLYCKLMRDSFIKYVLQQEMKPVMDEYEGEWMRGNELWLANKDIETIKGTFARYIDTHVKRVSGTSKSVLERHGKRIKENFADRIAFSIRMLSESQAKLREVQSTRHYYRHLLPQYNAYDRAILADILNVKTKSAMRLSDSQLTQDYFLNEMMADLEKKQKLFQASIVPVAVAAPAAAAAPKPKIYVPAAVKK